MNENFRRRVALREDIRNYDPQSGLGCSGDRIQFKPALSDKVLYLKRSQILAPDFNPRYPNQNRIFHDFEFWYSSFHKDKPLTLAHKELIESISTGSINTKFIILHDSKMGISYICELYLYWLQFFNAPGTDAAFISSDRIQQKASKCLLVNFIKQNQNNLGNKRSKINYLTSNMLNVSHGQQTNFYITAKQNLIIRNSNPQYLLCSNANDYVKTHKDTYDDYLYQISSSLIPHLHNSLVIIESSFANGVKDNYFLQLWEESLSQHSSYNAIHLPWYKSQVNSIPLSCSISQFVKSFSDTDHSLWSLGLTLEQINWYRHSIDNGEKQVNPTIPLYHDNRKQYINLKRKKNKKRVLKTNSETCSLIFLHAKPGSSPNNIIPITSLYTKLSKDKSPPGLHGQSKHVMRLPSPVRVA